jgi:hypothetical protein
MPNTSWSLDAREIGARSNFCDRLPNLSWNFRARSLFRIAGTPFAGKHSRSEYSATSPLVARWDQTRATQNYDVVLHKRSLICLALQESLVLSTATIVNPIDQLRTAHTNPFFGAELKGTDVRCDDPKARARAI